MNVAVAAVCRHAARRDDARPFDLARRDGVAEAVYRLRLAAEIDHGGEPGTQRASGEDDAVERRIRRRFAQRLTTLVRIGFARDVDVAVNEARHHEGVAQVDDLALAHIAVANFGDAAVLDDDGFRRLDPAGAGIGKQTPCLNVGGWAIGRGQRRRRRGCKQQPAKNRLHDLPPQIGFVQASRPQTLSGQRTYPSS